MRMIGEPADMAAVLETLIQAGYEVVANGKTYDARGAFGKRVYARVRRAAPRTTTARADRTDRARKQVPPRQHRELGPGTTTN